MRKGEYGVCTPCVELQLEKSVGFPDASATTAWKFKNDLHHKLHRANRRAHMKRCEDGRGDSKVLTVLSIDMTKPFHIPNRIRIADDFKNRKVIDLHAGGATSHGRQIRYILTHLPNLQHGTNTNITLLYHLIRSELWAPQTMSAWRLSLEIDGGPENTAEAMHHFLLCLIEKGWYSVIESHRLVRHHTHCAQDQVFYTLRYGGMNTTIFTTNFAQCLFKMMLGFKNEDGARNVLLLLNSAYDWQKYFAGNHNSNFRYYRRPLAYKYFLDKDDGRAKLMYKTFGDANKDWSGEEGIENGVPLQPHLGQFPSSEPALLEDDTWVTPEILKDVEFLASKYCSPEEQTWFREVLTCRRLTQLHYIREDPPLHLPGRPAYAECKDLAGKLWRIDLRVMDALPTDFWAVPPSRAAAIEARDFLTPPEGSRLNSVKLSSNKRTQQHPPWYGAQVMSSVQQTLHDNTFAGMCERNDPARVLEFLRKDSASLALMNKDVTAGALKAYMRVHAIKPMTGKKSQLAERVWTHHIQSMAHEGREIT